MQTCLQNARWSVGLGDQKIWFIKHHCNYAKNMQTCLQNRGRGSKNLELSNTIATRLRIRKTVYKMLPSQRRGTKDLELSNTVSTRLRPR